MKKIILFILLLYIPLMISAEEPKLEWQKSWGGSSNDHFYDFVRTQNNESIVVGETFSFDVENLENKGKGDAVILKYDKNGNLIWQKSWGGNDWDSFNSVILTLNNEYIVAGNSYSTDIEGNENKGKSDVNIVKYDHDGSVIWQKSWGGNKNDYFKKMILTKQEDLIVAVETTSTDIGDFNKTAKSDIVILKYNKNGDLIWQKSWGGNNYEYLYSLLLTKDDSFIVIGNSDSTDIEGISNNGGADAVIIKYDKNGNVIWQRNFGGAYYDSFHTVLLTSDDNFVIAGQYSSNNIEGIVIDEFNDNDFILLKIDQNGNVIWQKKGDGILYYWSETTKIAETQDGGIIVNGFISDSEEIEYTTVNTAYITKVDSEGNVVWNKNYDEEYLEYFNIIIPTKDNGILVSVEKYATEQGMEFYNGEEDAILLKYNKDGEIVWKEEWGGSNADIFKNIIASENEIVSLVYSYSTNLEGLTKTDIYDGIILKYLLNYDVERIIQEADNGKFDVAQQGNLGVINAQPNKGYEVDEIVIKDKEGNVLDVEVTEQEDGTLTFPLYTDVSVEVIYALAIDNPKTGILDVMTILIIGFIMSITGIFIVKNYNERLEL